MKAKRIHITYVFGTGFFDDHELAWLVNFEAGIVIQLPTGIFLLYPSALITHFNVNKNGTYFLVTLVNSQ
jgi:hypothetical protein